MNATISLPSWENRASFVLPAGTTEETVRTWAKQGFVSLPLRYALEAGLLREYADGSTGRLIIPFSQVLCMALPE